MIANYANHKTKSNILRYGMKNKVLKSVYKLLAYETSQNLQIISNLSLLRSGFDDFIIFSCIEEYCFWFYNRHSSQSYYCMTTLRYSILLYSSHATICWMIIER